MTGELKVWGRFSSPGIQVLFVCLCNSFACVMLGFRESSISFPFGCFALVEKETESLYRKIAASVPNDG